MVSLARKAKTNTKQHKTQNKNLEKNSFRSDSHKAYFANLLQFKTLQEIVPLSPNSVKKYSISQAQL